MGGQEVLIGISISLRSVFACFHSGYVLRDYDNTLPIFLEVP